MRAALPKLDKWEAVPLPAPDDGDLQEGVYAERLHPRDRVGRFADKPDLPSLPQGVTATGLKVPLWQTFKKAERAQAWLRERWPDKHFDLTGADMTVTGPALAQFVRLAEKYPFVVEGDAWSGISMSSPSDPDEFSRKLSADAHAGIRRDDNRLLLNPASWGDPVEFRKALEAAEFAEWHPPHAATPEAMLTHEFAHLLDRALRAQKDKAFLRPHGYNHGVVADTWSSWVKEADTLPVSGYAVQASRGLFDTVENSERVAEAFASIYHTPPELKDEYVLRMQLLLDEITDETKWTPVVNDEAISFKGERSDGREPVTDEEREAFKAERDEWKARLYGSLWTIRNAGTELYNATYPKEYDTWVKELWDRRHAYSAEVRERALEKKKAEAARRSERLKARRLELVDELAPKLRVEGVSDDEIRTRISRQLAAEGLF